MEKSGLFTEECQRIRSGCCPICNKPVDPFNFKDQISRDEFQISGMCQECQDLIFSTSFEEALEDLSDQAIAEVKAEAHWNDQADYFGGECNG